MGKKVALAVVTLLIFTGFAFASPVEQGNTFMEKFIKAFNAGNYSLIEPYLGKNLREQFTKEYFMEIRNFTIVNYGRLTSFRLVSNTTAGDMVKLEYKVKAEKGSFPVLLVYKNGKLVGIGLGVKAKPNPSGMIAMILGSLIVLGTLYFVRRPLIPDLVLGTGIALGLSVIVPFYGIVSLLLFDTTPSRSLFTAFVTAVTVEAAKFYFSRRRDGLSLGLGLGIGQYVLLAIGTFVATNFIMQLPVSFTGKTYWAFLFALTFTAFHALSAETYSKMKKPLALILFVLIEGSALALESSHGVLSLLLVIAGIIAGLKLGGVMDGIAGREAR